jgi:hypothetical protein
MVFCCFVLDYHYNCTRIIHFRNQNFFPNIIASKAHRARARIQAALNKYYRARLDDHAAQIVQARAGVLRRYGFPDGEIGNFELTLLHVSTINTIPTLFWFPTFVLADSEMLGRLREEVQYLLQHDGEARTINITQIEDRCPLLVRRRRGGQSGL